MVERSVAPVLDTHVLLWMVLDSKRLSKEARKAIERAAQRGGLSIAAISMWEIAQMVALGRLTIQGTLSDWLTRLLSDTGIGVIGINPVIAELSTLFGADFPKDPADRLIAATARANAAVLITADERIRHSPLVKALW